MATKIYISGNFLVGEDSIVTKQYFKVKTANAYHLRDESDNFAFFNEGVAPKTEGSAQSLQLGVQNSWSWDSTDLVQTSQTNFPFADILDGNGVPYASADALSTLFDSVLGSCVGGGGGGGLSTVSHDSTLSGDGTVGNPLGVVGSGQTYTETNVINTRNFNANSTKLNEVADVLGTLIKDLRSVGIIE